MMFMLNMDNMYNIDDMADTRRDRKHDKLISVLAIAVSVIVSIIILINGAFNISEKSFLPDVITGGQTVTVTAEVTGTENVMFKGRRMNIAYSYDGVEYTKQVSPEKYGISSARKGDKFNIEIDVLSPTSIRPSSKADSTSLGNKITGIENDVLYSGAGILLVFVVGLGIYILYKAKNS